MNIGTKPFVSENAGQSFSEKRSYLRKTSKVIENQLYKSLQTCKVEHNLLRLQSLRNESSSKSFCRRLDALICIFEMLNLPSNYETTDIDKNDDELQLIPFGILDFKIAAELYADIASIPIQCRLIFFYRRLVILCKEATQDRRS